MKWQQTKTKVQREMLGALVYAGDAQQRGKCKKVWIEFHMLVTTLIW